MADCIEKEVPWDAYGDLGPLLGQAIRESKLCKQEYRLGKHTIRATVMGAGCYSTQLSGSTIFHRNVSLPLKNLPVAESLSGLQRLDGPGVLALAEVGGQGYEAVTQLAEEISAAWPPFPVIVALRQDLAKALGHALALRLGRERPILCIDRVKLTTDSFLDIGAPVGPALPVVVKTLVLQSNCG